MILDSEDQRAMLIHCLENTYFTGTVTGLMQPMTDVMTLIETVKKAEIRNGSEDISGKPE
jgi:hypothetical protein